MEKDSNNRNELRETDFSILNDKTDIEKIMASEGLKLGEERSRHMGAEKEDILSSFTIEELERIETYNKLEKELRHPQAKKILIRGKLFSEIIVKIIKIAKKNNIPYMVLKNPEFKGNIGLVILKEQN